MAVEITTISETIRRYVRVNLETKTPGFLVSILLEVAHKAYGERGKKFKIPEKNSEKFENLYVAFLDLADGIEAKDGSKMVQAYRRIAKNLEYENLE